MATKILPWNQQSESAALLARTMHVQRVIRDSNRSRYRSRPGDVIINWGCSVLPEHCSGDALIINRAFPVRIATDKGHTLSSLSSGNISCPRFTSNVDTAREWQAEGATVVVRTLLRSRGGRGIIIVEPNQEVPPYYPLYVEYIPKLAEYRVHVVNTEQPQAFVVQKRRRRDVPDDQVNWKIRNFDNGFAFAAQLAENSPVDRLKEIAIASIQRLGLDFGAVDVIYNRRSDSLYVLEINSAPGLSDRTAQWYSENLSTLISEYTQ